ncbi:MAG: hypothetical protein Q9208_001033 [Pyrenodesmia sp. 3 TL-2023]
MPSSRDDPERTKRDDSRRTSQRNNPFSSSAEPSIRSTSGPLSPTNPHGIQANPPQGRSSGVRQPARTEGDPHRNREESRVPSGDRPHDGKSTNTLSPRGPEDGRPQIHTTPIGHYKRGRDRPPSGSEIGKNPSPMSPHSRDSQKSGRSRVVEEPPSPTASGRQALALRPIKAASPKAGLVQSGTDDKASVLKMLAVNSKQTMHGNTLLLCYRLKKPSAGQQHSQQEQSKAAFIKGLSKANFNVPSNLTLTDYRHVVIIFSDSSDNGSSPQEIDCGFKLMKLATITWETVLMALHTAMLPKAPEEREGVLSFLQALLSQKHGSSGVAIPKAKLSPVLTIHGGPFECKKSLAILMRNFLLSDGGNFRGLETYVKGLRISIPPTPKKDQASKSNKEKTITGLARPDDGRRSKGSLPPRVKNYGGGSKDVEFYYKPERKYITVFDYFREHKRYTISDVDLPLINIGTRSKPTYIPPEHCNLVERGRGEALVLSVGDVVDIVKNRTAKLPLWLSNGDHSDDTRYPGLKMPLAETLSLCQITMTADTLLTSCRTKVAPLIQYREGVKTETVSGSWSIMSSGMRPPTSMEPNKVNPPPLVEMRCSAAVLIIGCGGWPASEQASKTIQALRAQLQVFGVALLKESPLGVVTEDEKLTQQLQADIRDQIMEIKKKAEVVVIMLHDKSRLLYDYVKQVCDLEAGIHSVCLDAFKLAIGLAMCGNNNGYCFQTALKINVKTGRHNQVLQHESLEAFDMDSTLVAGVDIMTSPMEGKVGPKTMALMVASVNPELSQWPAAVCILGKQPLQQDLSDLLATRIDLWKQRNKRKTLQRIIIYHNGLLEDACVFKLLEGFNSATEAKATEAKLTLLVVNKDHHTKLQTLASIDKIDKDKSYPKHAIITRSSDRAKAWEFAIQRHVLKRSEGDTSKASNDPGYKPNLPVRYTILHDDIFTSPGSKKKLEDLTHDMQYLSSSSTAAISKTLPIHYVGLLRERIELYGRNPGLQKSESGDSAMKGTNGLGQHGMSDTPFGVHKDIRDQMFYI